VRTSAIWERWTNNEQSTYGGSCKQQLRCAELASTQCRSLMRVALGAAVPHKAKWALNNTHLQHIHGLFESACRALEGSSLATKLFDGY